jgi:hypothetical protein
MARVKLFFAFAGRFLLRAISGRRGGFDRPASVAAALYVNIR